MSNLNTTPKFYDGTKLLSMQDIDGEKPVIYMVTSNRSAGKTTFFVRMLIKKFIDNGEKFCILYRWKKELNDIARKVFTNVSWKFPGYSMLDKKREKGNFCELLLKKDDEKAVTCGYAIAINGSDDIRKSSGELSAISRIFMDEFQSETNKYCPNEIEKFQSIYTTIARGNGQQSRYVPIYMCSNPVSILNPYFSIMNVASKLRKDTKFLKGKGWVLEQNLNDSARMAMTSSAFAKAMSGSNYIEYATDGKYLLDDNSFIEKPKNTPTTYIATFIYNGQSIALRQGMNDIFYFGGNIDDTYPLKIFVTNDDATLNASSLRANSGLMRLLRTYWDNSMVRFSDLQARECALRAIARL